MKKLKTLLLVLTAMFALGLTACSKGNNAGSDKKVTVVTSTNVYADIAKQVLGKYGTAKPVISNGDTDPHDFEPTTSSAKIVSGADIVIANGMGYDNWMNHLAESNGKKAVKVGEQIMGKKSSDNPHIWYDLKMPKEYVDYLVKKASKIAPKHASYFKKQGAAYLAKIAKIQALAKTINGSKEKPVFVSEPVFDYALTAAGFKIGDTEFENAIENETDPSAKTIHTVQNKLKHGGFSLFVNNTQASSSTVNNMLKIAKANKVKVIDVRETMPNGVSYYDWMYKNYQNLAKLFEK
ncbi:metal ABC transporter solute-binding protein, Zn/Mn family [Lactobacillus corticis]|uniref:Metal ABC transporter substrate-binding protein n=1 Tax=Lactobacillus corticis TaxID=2201249 RepID=A0A916QFY4_9LACO|nr:zinc ABC transporter substrate-binding protein [Lactobacillus corticis]GFZ26576.1 metal ABC transporter substrate-binding protein [Lactobacillus corticis]